jgi:hypothetical protein
MSQTISSPDSFTPQTGRDDFHVVPLVIQQKHKNQRIFGTTWKSSLAVSGRVQDRILRCRTNAAFRSPWNAAFMPQHNIAEEICPAPVGAQNGNLS